MKMYAYIYDCTATSDTLAEIQLMETVKTSLVKLTQLLNQK